MLKLIRNADVLVNPSYFEGFGTILLESMSAGTPVIAYDLEGYREFAVNGFNALLVSLGDLGKLIDAIYSVLTDMDLASSLVRNSLRTTGKFDWSNTVEKTRDVYKLVIQSSS